MAKRHGARRARRARGGPLRWVACVAAALAACRPAPPPPWNVLFVLVDDLRPALGCYGDRYARSPNIDRLAQEGFVFERAYCQQAQCNPSRESLLAGCRPDTTGVHDLRSRFREALPDAVSLPQLFLQAGYETRAYGKVHHGNGRLDDPLSWSRAPWYPDEDDDYHSAADERALDEARERLEEQGYDAPARGLAFQAPDVEDAELIDGAIAAQAIAALEELRDRPFFLAVGFKKPHLPFVAPKRWWDRFPADGVPLAESPAAPEGVPSFALTDSEELRAFHEVPDEGPISEELRREAVRGYYACVAHVDHLVGELYAALVRLELDQRTIVVVWGDHGYHLGEHGLWTKFTNFEEAARAPWIVRVPGAAWAGRRSERLVEFVDVYPTLAELCGLDAPPDLEGTSCVPLLRDPDRPWKRAAFGQYARRVGEERLEVVGRTMRTERYRYTAWRSATETFGEELYDYERDPLGARNAASDPAYAEVRAELALALDAGWRAALPEAETPE